MTTLLHKIKVGSRASPLSIAQTNEVLAPLRHQFPDINFVVVQITTSGDRDKHASLLSLGRGTFVKEIESSLLRGDIDIAVHSAKDLPATLPMGLILASTMPRKDPRDALINRWDLPLGKLPRGARIGTSSPRRTAQLKALRPDIEIIPIRGNVGTRLQQIHSENYDGVILGAGGLLRLKKTAEISEYLSPDTFTPDVGQGTLAVESRANDPKIIEMLSTINDGPSSLTLQAEREFLSEIGGGCQVPVAAYAQIESAYIRISAMAAAPDGSKIFRTETINDANNPLFAGRQTAKSLLDTGGKDIIYGN